MPKLTKRLIDAIEPENKDVFVRDSEIKGFICKVTPKGRKVYLLYYRTTDGRERRPVIGVHGNITCEEARDIAKKWHARVVSGEDPSQEKQTSRKIPTVKQIGEQYLEDKQALLKPRSWNEIKRVWARDVTPALGSKKLSQLTIDDVRKFHRSNAHRPAAANRTVEIMRTVINYAMQQKWITLAENPCAAIQKYPEKARERFLNKEEIKKLREVLDACEADRSETASAVNCFRLLMLTGCRLSEILLLEWSFIDWDQHCLRLPDSKTGAKTIYLAPEVVQLLKTIPRQENTPYVIAGKIPGKPLAPPQKAWRRIRARAGLEDVRIHDLRHSFASIGAANGLSLQMIGALLGHKDTQTTARYAHLFGDSLREAAAVIGRTIEQS